MRRSRRTRRPKCPRPLRMRRSRPTYKSTWSSSSWNLWSQPALRCSSATRGTSHDPTPSTSSSRGTRQHQLSARTFVSNRGEYTRGRGEQGGGGDSTGDRRPFATASERKVQFLHVSIATLLHRQILFQHQILCTTFCSSLTKMSRAASAPPARQILCGCPTELWKKSGSHLVREKS